MKKIKYIILTLVLGSCILASCHKYPEDPSISFRRPINRLGWPGGWHLWHYYINGVDSMSNLMKNYPSPLNGATNLDFFISATHQSSIDFQGDIGTGSFSLENNSNALKVTLSSLMVGFYNPFINTTTDWTIVELTTNRLVITSTINNKNYKLIFTD